MADVTEELTRAAVKAFNGTAPIRGMHLSMRAALLAVAPLIAAAARRTALEEARDAVILLAAQIGAKSDAAKKAGDIDAVSRLDTAWSLLLDAATAIRALGRPA